jgi:choline dehydrogenase-like flavoprotein
MALPARAGESAWGPDHHLLFRERFGRGQSWGLFGEDLPNEDNRVEIDDELTDSSGVPAPKIVYRVSENSHRMLDFHIEKASESMTEAGAHKVETDQLMRYSGWHLLGTARMGDDRATSVVDRWGRSHDIPNLYVVDGSVFVTSSGTNPTSTIAALAMRTAEHMVSDRFNQDVPV